MKDGIFKKLKDNVKNAINFQDDYIEDDEDYGDGDYDGYDDYDDAPTSSDVSGGPVNASSLNVAPYTPYTPASTQTIPLGSYSNSFSAPQSQPLGTKLDAQNASKKGSGNIYHMNEAKPTGKLKVSLFVLEDMDDARNVADCMIERNIVTICDFTKITSDEQRRVLDFLDGVKYVCNSRIENISSRIYLIVPEAAELSGDFFSQIDQDTLY